MTKRILTVIHHYTEIDLENFAYTQMYVGTNGCTATINGTTGDFHPNTKMDLILRTLSNASGDLYFLGYGYKKVRVITDDTETYYLVTDTGEVITTDDGSSFTYLD